MDILKIVSLAIITSIIIVLIKQIKPEFATTVLVCSTILMLIYSLKYLTDIFNIFDEILLKTGIDNGLFLLLIKIVSIAYLVEFASSICDDTGNSSLSSKVVFAGKISIFLMAVPIIKNLFNLIIGLL